MLDTKDLAKEIWLVDDLEVKKNLAFKMIDKLHAKNITKEKFRNDINKCRSKNKIDKLVADLTLIGYDMKVL